VAGSVNCDTQGELTAMNVPTIGGARGIFEVFVPGLFLFLNLVGVAYLMPFMDQDSKHFIEVTAANPGLSLAIVISFGYLLGIVLRLIPPSWPDGLSAIWLGRFGDPDDKPARRELRKARFPYIEWVCSTSGDRLPREVSAFYQATWGDPDSKVKRSKTFFNFMKVMLSDEKAKDEVYAAEAMTRYISGMFYALLASVVLIGAAWLACGALSGKWMAGLLVVIVAYSVAGLVIVRRFRTIRVKEVEAVFAASYRNRELFQRMNETGGPLGRVEAAIGGMLGKMPREP
jgi:hypothetical protein